MVVHFNKAKLIMLISLLVVFPALTISTFANDVQSESKIKYKGYNPEERFRRNHIVFDVGYHVEINSEESSKHRVNLQFMGFINRYLAAQVKLGHSGEGRIKDKNYNSAINLSFGIRIQPPDKPVNPYIELFATALSSLGTSSWANGFDQNKPGRNTYFGVGTGVSFKTSLQTYIDLGLDHGFFDPVYIYSRFRVAF